MSLGDGKFEGEAVAIDVYYKTSQTLYIFKRNTRCQNPYCHVFLNSSSSMSKGKCVIFNAVFILKKY